MMMMKAWDSRNDVTKAGIFIHTNEHKNRETISWPVFRVCLVFQGSSFTPFNKTVVRLDTKFTVVTFLRNEQRLDGIAKNLRAITAIKFYGRPASRKVASLNQGGQAG